MTIRTRFAPSPSGHLHVGGARTALFCWAYATARGGHMILRIEDTDRKRTSDAAGMAFLEDLDWLGIGWGEGPVHGEQGGGDAGPYHQSERRHLYDADIDRLIESGAAYRAFETPDELNAARERARAANENYRYDRAALALDQATIDGYLAEGRPHVVRFKVPDGREVVFTDEVRGEVTLPAGELDDFVIRKADGFPTYHFAVVVDDEHMKVTHVIRGEEHLHNTFRHVLLQEALGYARPTYAHLSVITNPDGSKMSKRDKDKTLRAVVRERGLASSAAVDAERWAWWLEKKDRQLELDETEALAAELDVELPAINVGDFRRAGYLADVLINYLALLGWSPGGDVEQFDRAFLLERFDFDRIIKSAAKFDRDKLLAFNLAALQAMDPDEFVARYRAHCAAFHPDFLAALGDERFDMLARANQPRSKTLDDTIKSSAFFVTSDDEIEYVSSKPVRKALCNGEPCGYEHLEAVRPILAGLDDWSVDALDAALEAYAAEHADGKLGKVAQPLRIAVSGGPVSPAIYETLVILGRDSVLARIDRCLAQRGTLCTT